MQTIPDGKSKKTLILDLYGVVYSTKKLTAETSGDSWDTAFGQLNRNSSSDFEKATWTFWDKTERKSQIDKLISEAKLGRESEIFCVTSEALDVSRALFATYKVAVFSTVSLEKIQNIVRGFLEVTNQTEMLDQIDLNSGHEFGDKTNPETWVKLFNRYPDAEVLVDDTDVNLHAASIAAITLHRTIRLLPSLKEIN